MIRVAVDAMGGDNAPYEVVKGCVMALSQSNNIIVHCVGNAAEIEKILGSETYDKERLVVVDAPEVIGMGEVPTTAIRTKKNSSLVIGMKLVKNGEADAFVSAGNTGAVLVGGQTIIGRLPGVDRAPLGMLIPTLKGVSLLIDCGANVDARPDHLLRFAKLGSEYYKKTMGVDSPTVGLINIGTEEEKGNALVKETRPLLEAEESINYIGYVESREIPKGGADVLVCEAFTGNVILKLYEGLASSLMAKIKEALMSSFISKLGALMIKPALKKTLKSFDASSYGGAPMLGLKNLVIKTHGNSKAIEINNSILQCEKYLSD